MFCLRAELIAMISVVVAFEGHEHDESDPEPYCAQSTDYSLENSTHTYDIFRVKFFECDDYVKIPPNVNSPHLPVDITIRMDVISLLHLDIRTQTFLVTAVFQVEWYDKKMSWDLSEFPYTEVLLNGYEVWRPVLAIANSLGPRDKVMKSKIPMVLHPDGLILWWPGETFELDCNIDIRFYPFDVQDCIVRVTQWVGSSKEVRYSNAVLHLNTVGNGQWDIVEISTTRFLNDIGDDQKWTIDFGMTLKRRWTFYAMNLVFPIVLVSGLNCVVFLLPVECGEKMSVSVTTFLTLAIFLKFIQEEIPTNSDSICYLAVYLIVQMTLGALAIFLSALQVECHHIALVEGGLWDRQQEVASTIGRNGSIDEGGKARFEEGNKRRVSKATSKARIYQLLRLWTPVVAEMDFYCFPIFMALNMLSIFTYLVVIVQGPMSHNDHEH